jgi:hypothetical protein
MALYSTPDNLLFSKLKAARNPSCHCGLDPQFSGGIYRELSLQWHGDSGFRRNDEGLAR